MAICIFFNKRATLSAVMSLAGCSLTGEPMLLHTSCTKNKNKNPADRTLLETLTLSTLVHIDLFAFYENATHVNSNERSIHSKSPSWKSIHQKYRSINLLLKCSVPVTYVTARGSGPLPKGDQINLRGFRWLKEEERINKSAFKMLPLPAFNIFKSCGGCLS